MKIGTFARKFSLNVSAVRFYINNGLLSPLRVGGQYEFDRTCVSDMERIQRYKRFNFSLEEIQLLFFMEKASRLQDAVVLDVCADLLKQKREQLLADREQLSRSIRDIEEEIARLPVLEPPAPQKSGVPFSMIPYLYCPRCQVPLQLDSASLAGGWIQKGLLSCECGYAAEIADGVILCSDRTDETPFKAFENVESVMAMKVQFSPLYRSLITKAYIWMERRIAERAATASLLLTGPFPFNFLLEYIDKLSAAVGASGAASPICIVADPSRKRIDKMKRYLANRDVPVVFITGKPDELPLKRGSVDLYIDDYSTVNSLFTYGTFCTKHLAPLLKDGGEAIGIFTTYNAAPRSLRNFRNDHPDFQPEKMTFGNLKSHWADGHVRIAEEKSIGKTTPGESHFPQNAPGEVIGVSVYRARKQG